MRLISIASITFVMALVLALSGVGPVTQARQGTHPDGQAIFRYYTFGDEQLWTDVLRMHEVIPTVSPATALAVGLKVDVEALPNPVVDALRAGKVDLTNPAVTVELLRLNAVVGVKGAVDAAGSGDRSQRPRRPTWVTETFARNRRPSIAWRMRLLCGCW